MGHNFVQEKSTNPGFGRKVSVGIYLPHGKTRFSAHIPKIAVMCQVSVAMVTITLILTLVTAVWVHFTHVFEIFLGSLIFVYLECKFSLRKSHDVLIFLLMKQLHKFKMAEFEKICQDWAKFKLLYLYNKVRYGAKIFNFY